MVSVIAHANGQPQYAGSKLTVSAASFDDSTFASLFSPALRRQTLALMALYFLLAYGCGVFVWMPVLLQEKNLEVTAAWLHALLRDPLVLR